MFEIAPLAGPTSRVPGPEGTPTGKQFRLRGKGVKGVRSSYPGDLYCHVSVETPVKMTEHQRKLMKDLDESFRKGGGKHSPGSSTWAMPKLRTSVLVSTRCPVTPAMYPVRCSSMTCARASASTCPTTSRR